MRTEFYVKKAVEILQDSDKINSDHVRVFDPEKPYLRVSATESKDLDIYRVIDMKGGDKLVVEPYPLDEGSESLRVYVREIHNTLEEAKSDTVHPEESELVFKLWDGINKALARVDAPPKENNRLQDFKETLEPVYRNVLNGDFSIHEHDGDEVRIIAKGVDLLVWCSHPYRVQVEDQVFDISGGKIPVLSNDPGIEPDSTGISPNDPVLIDITQMVGRIRQEVFTGITHVEAENPGETRDGLTEEAGEVHFKSDVWKQKEHDEVNHPAHYTDHPKGFECIDVIEDFPHNVATAMKYLWRGGKKEDLIKDLRKAIWYTERRIKQVKEERARAKKQQSNE